MPSILYVRSMKRLSHICWRWPKHKTNTSMPSVWATMFLATSEQSHNSYIHYIHMFYCIHYATRNKANENWSFGFQKWATKFINCFCSWKENGVGCTSCFIFWGKRVVNPILAWSGLNSHLYSKSILDSLPISLTVAINFY